MQYGVPAVEDHRVWRDADTLTLISMKHLCKQSGFTVKICQLYICLTWLQIEAIQPWNQRINIPLRVAGWILRHASLISAGCKSLPACRCFGRVGLRVIWSGWTLDTLWRPWIHMGGWKLIVVVFWKHPNHLKMIRFSNHYPFLLIHINLTKHAHVSFNSTVAIGPFFITLSTSSFGSRRHLQDLLQRPHPTSHQSPTPWQTASLRRRERCRVYRRAKSGGGFRYINCWEGRCLCEERLGKIWKYEIWIQVLWRWTEMVIDDITWY